MQKEKATQNKQSLKQEKQQNETTFITHETQQADVVLRTASAFVMPGYAASGGGIITINGGTVTATVEGGNVYGAVIGEGLNGNGGTILLKNADMLTVSANGKVTSGTTLIGKGNEDNLKLQKKGDYKHYSLVVPTDWTGEITPKEIGLKKPTEAITKIYDGTTAVAYTPLLEGVVGGDAVSLAEGYTLAFDGADAGKQTISASNLSLAGEKAGNYTVQATAEFAGEITAKPLTHEDIEIALSIEKFTENGSRQVPDATVTDKGNALAKDKDYTVTEPEESIIPGDYQLAFTGMGNYQGSVTKPYTIVAKPAPTAYAVILTQPTGGTLTASTSSAIEGTTVALSYTENTDYDFGHWIAQDADGNTVDVADDNTFVMPAANVSITAVFNYNPPITPDPTDPTLYTVTLPFVEGATTDPSDGPYEVEEGKDFEFTLTLNQDYNLSVPVVTTSRGETLKPLNQGTYVIEDIYDDLNIYISGIVKNPEPVANASIEANVVKVWGGNGYLYLQLGTARKVSVYTFSGSLFRCDEVPVGDTRWSLPTGNYIVRIADKSYKVIVR